MYPTEYVDQTTEGECGMNTREGGEYNGCEEGTWYRNLFKSSGLVVILVDPKTRVIADMNRAACEFYGYGEEEMAGMPITVINVLPEDDANRRLAHEDLYDRLAGSGPGAYRRFSLTHRLTNGELRNVEVFSGPVSVRGKTLIYSMIHDVTGIVRAQEAMRAEHEFRMAIERVSRMRMLGEAGKKSESLMRVMKI